MTAQLWKGRRWNQYTDTPGLRATFRLLGDTMSEWPTVPEILQTFTTLPPPTAEVPARPARQLKMPVDVPADFYPLSEGTQLIRDAIGVIPNGQRARFIGILAAELFSAKNLEGYGEGRRATIADACRWAHERFNANED